MLASPRQQRSLEQEIRTMRTDRKGQVWQICCTEFNPYTDKAESDWRVFTIVSTSEETYETIAGESRKFVRHKVVVSESGAVVELNEDTSIPWEDCVEEYKRVA